MALATCKAAAKILKLPVTQVLPASTGVIGVELDPKLIVNALPRLVEQLAEDRFGDVARAIMTTDTVPKEAFGEVKLRRGVMRIAGMTKGSGMIQPLMATTLGFVMTDANIPAARRCGACCGAARSAATTGCPWTATHPPTIRWCCWRTARRACGPIRRSSKRWKRA